MIKDPGALKGGIWPPPTQRGDMAPADANPACAVMSRGVMLEMSKWITPDENQGDVFSD